MPSSEEFDFAALRAEMVETIAVQARLVSALIGRDRFDERVMATMASVWQNNLPAVHCGAYDRIA